MRNSKKIEGSATAARFFAILAAALLPLSISALSDQQSKPGLNQHSSSGFSATGIAGQQQAAPSQPAQSKSDPAAWGSNHIGKPIPEYVHGDECLFCHRNKSGDKSPHCKTLFFRRLLWLGGRALANEF